MQIEICSEIGQVVQQFAQVRWGRPQPFPHRQFRGEVLESNTERPPSMARPFSVGKQFGGRRRDPSTCPRRAANTLPISTCSRRMHGPGHVAKMSLGRCGDAQSFAIHLWPRLHFRRLDIM
jgi:hypothetical protein